MITLSFDIIRRMLEEFERLQKEGYRIKDPTLFEDLDKEIASFERAHPYESSK